MTAPLIAPVIPSLGPARRGRASPAPRRPLRCRWLATPGGPPVLQDVVYGIGRIDASGQR